MCQAYRCLPTDLWHFDPTTPKGFYFNRGVFYFGRKVDNEMQEAENNSRKHKKPGPGTERLVNAARLGALSRNLGVPIKRHRDPGQVSNSNPFVNHGDEGPDERRDLDETIVISTGF